MTITFNMILSAGGVDPADVRLLRHKDRRSLKGRTPYELWRSDRPAFELYQSHQMPSKRTQLAGAKFWASFLGLADNRTLFVGLYMASYQGVLKEAVARPHMPGVEEAGSRDVYALALAPQLNDLIGRLYLDWGAGKLSWLQYANRQEKPVTELLTAFKEEDFPGFGAFIAPLSKIDSLPAGWKAALTASRGIYLLTCPKTKEVYVGSATGQEGFLGRWKNYAQNGHGGNLGLKSRDPSDYQVSILEVAGSALTAPEILQMEQRWIRKLQSDEMGLNR